MTKEEIKLKGKVLEDIRANPEKHKHTYDELMQCCWIGGSINTEVLFAHSKYIDFGRGLRGCDVKEGTCGCGGYHAPSK